MKTYQEVFKQIRAGEFVPVYVFFGEEKFIQEELVAQLSRSFLGEEERYGREKLEGGAYGAEEIIGKLTENGLFASRKLLIVENPPYLSPPRSKDHADVSQVDSERKGEDDPQCALLVDYLDRLSPDSPQSILVFLLSSVDRRKRLFKIIEKKGVTVECNSLKGEVLAAWIKRRVERSGKKIDRAAVDKLLMAGEANLHYLVCELDKYIAYLSDGEQSISAEVVDLLFSGDIQGDVFKLSDALVEGDPYRAEACLELLLRKREKPLLIFFMLVRNYRLLLQAKCLFDEGLSQHEIRSVLKLHPFVARKLRGQAAYCSKKVLEDVMIALQETDRSIKTGRVDPEQALKLIIGRIDCLQSAN